MSWDVYIVKDPPEVCSCGKATESVESKCCFSTICPACGEKWPSQMLTDGGRNYTANTIPMLQIAARETGCIPTSIWTKETAEEFKYVGNEFDNKNAKYVGECLGKCIAWMKVNHVQMEAMNPPNGWGSFGTFVNFLSKWKEDCDNHPTGMVRISR